MINEFAYLIVLGLLALFVLIFVLLLDYFMNKRKKFLCLDCNVDTGKIYEHYFINTDLWLSVVLSTKGMLCIVCLENRLGRKLNKHDFPKVYINNPGFSRMSQRLLNRINGE